MSKAATINKKLTDSQINNERIEQFSSQGVRDFPIENKQKQMK